MWTKLNRQFSAAARDSRKYPGTIRRFDKRKIAAFCSTRVSEAFVKSCETGPSKPLKESKPQTVLEEPFCFRYKAIAVSVRPRQTPHSAIAPSIPAVRSKKSNSIRTFGPPDEVGVLFGIIARGVRTPVQRESIGGHFDSGIW